MSEAAIGDASALPDIEDQTFPISAVKVGMICVMCCEAVMFASLIIAYVIYIGQSRVGPYPSEALSLPLALLNTVFLVSSSLTIGLANRALRKNRADDAAGDGSASDAKARQKPFRFWMTVTLLLASLFLCGTGYEWWDLIVKDGLTISRNLFGSTYFTLIGCHGLHVLIGVAVMGVFVFLSQRQLLACDSDGPEILEWYWHLVDAVWIVIVCVVYVWGT